MKLHQRRDLIEGLARSIIYSGKNQYELHDQHALYDILWPVAKYDVVSATFNGVFC